MIAALAAIWPIPFACGLLYIAANVVYRVGLPVLRFVVNAVDRVLGWAAERVWPTPRVLRGGRRG